MGTMKLNIVTPERNFFSGDVQGIKLKGPEGYFEVLPRHTDMVAAIVASEIRIIESNGEHREAFTSDGFVEVTKSKVSVVVDAAEWPEEIDENRSDDALRRAQERIDKKDGNDIARAELALKRAIARKKVKNF